MNPVLFHSLKKMERYPFISVFLYEFPSYQHYNVFLASPEDSHTRRNLAVRYRWHHSRRGFPNTPLHLLNNPDIYLIR